MVWEQKRFMKANPPNEVHGSADPVICLARSVADALAEEPTLEAVTIDRARQTISVATLGNADVPRLTARVRASVEAAQHASSESACSLLAGAGDCSDCPTPLSEPERKPITIRREEESTTIARVTCPTAPKFWRWRDIPLPRVVQRDVEFLEHAHEVDEWKAQLAAAILCGVFGLGALALSPRPIAIGAYALAYL